MAERQHKYLRAEDIRRLNAYEFLPSAVVDGYLTGRTRSLSQGSSTEFRDYRPYVPGDDLRRVDWRVYARTDRPYIRTFNQETNQVCHVFLDSSASMGFGRDMTKLEFASFFSACLCYLVAKTMNLVSLHTFDTGIRASFPPASTRRHLDAMLNHLERNEPGQETAISTALTKVFPLLRQRGSVIVISDFFDDPAAVFTALNPYLHAGHRVYLYHIVAPEELELDERGLVTFVDMETGQRVMAHTERLRKEYRAGMDAHIQHLREYASRRQVHYELARTDSHFFSLFDPLVT